MEPDKHTYTVGSVLFREMGEKMLWLGKCTSTLASVSIGSPVRTRKVPYRVGHMFNVVTHFFFFSLCIWTWLVQLDSDISICLYLDWLWKLAAAAQRFLSNQAAGSVPRQMRTIPLAVLRRVAHINYPIDSLSCACFVLKWVVYVSYGRTEKPLEATFCFQVFFLVSRMTRCRFVVYVTHFEKF